MPTVEELSKALAELQSKFGLVSEELAAVRNECKILKEENNSMKNKLGIRQFLQPKANASEKMNTDPASNESSPTSPDNHQHNGQKATSLLCKWCEVHL
jgi:regulator of replication initiation timing